MLDGFFEKKIQLRWRLQHEYFSVDIAEYLKTDFL